MRLAPAPAAPSPSLPTLALALARILHRRTAVDGGFTVDGSGRPVGTGLAVCTEPARTLGFPLTAWDHEAVARWLERNLPLHGGRRLGGWRVEDRGWVCLDVVTVLPAGMGDRARTLARRHGQAAVFDLAARRLVPARG
jgi:hypothetical protein